MTMNSECWDDGRVPSTNEYKRLPKHVQDALTRYLVEGDPFTGEFLGAVLANDLFKAVDYADAESMGCLKDLVLVIYNRMPSDCWGSKEKVKAWQDLGGWNGWRKQQRLKAEPCG